MTKSKIKKIFVVDTNVLLHDPKGIEKFQEHDVVLPIYVIEEIDKFKKGLDSININAREFSRTLDKISNDQIFNGGIPIGKKLGKVSIALSRPFHEDIKQNLIDNTIDNCIINIAYCLMKDHEVKSEDEKRQIILVSKDTNVRLKAKALGLLAQDFLHEKVADVDFLSDEVQTVMVDEKVIAGMYQKEKNNPVDFPVEIKSAIENQNFILKSKQGGSALVKWRSGLAHLITKESLYAFHLKPRNSEQAFAMDALLDPSIEIVTIEGNAGTGKTIITLACAIHQLEKKIYDHVSFGRKIIAVGNHELGFLPGGVDEKINPYMGGMEDNLAIIAAGSDEKVKKPKPATKSKSAEYITGARAAGHISIEALGFIRGRSLSKQFFIIDEAQNLTPHEVKTIVTRAGVGTKIVLIGDTHQIDSPYLDQRSNGFTYLIEKFRGQNNYSHIHLIKSERSRLAEQAGKLL